MSFKLHLMGTFQAKIDERPLTQFRTNKIRALLAYLAVENGRPHRRDTLATLLWPNNDDKTARKNLRLSYYRLRQAIDNQTGDGFSERLFTSDKQSIQAITDPTVFWTDTAVFQTLLNDCDTHSHADLHTCAPCLARLSQIVNLYRGELLPGFHLEDAETFDEWLLMMRERLHRQTLDALETLITSSRQQQQYEKMREYAQRQLMLEPWREASYRSLMQAHVHLGQRSAALSLYDACRQALLDELGVVPDVETEALYEQIRAGTISKRSIAPQTKIIHNLPTEVTSFIGRETEIKEISQQLQSGKQRMVTITGPGGQGKTRLSLAVAWQQVATEEAAVEDGRFWDGIYYIPLDALEDPNKLTHAIVNALQLPLSSDRQQLHSFTEQALDYLRDKHILLVLDNFEHLLAGIPILETILQTAPAVQMLITSRERLNHYGEYVYAIDGLAYPQVGMAANGHIYPAMALFQQRARMVGSNRSFREKDWEHVAQICRLAHGLPLAIELAAAWSDMFTPAEIVAEIEQNLDFLESELRGLSPRHQNMRVVFNASWNNLVESERDAYAQLSVFRGGFSRSAAEKVVGVTLRTLTRLVRKSLLSYDKTNKRYEFHELLRRYSAEKLANHPNLSVLDLQERHGRYYCHWLDAQTSHLKDRHQIETLAAINRRLENIRAAWRWAIQQPQIRQINQALGSLAHFYRMQSRFDDGETAMWQALNYLDTQPDTPEIQILRGKLIANRGWFAYFLGRSDEGLSLLQEGIDLLEQANAGTDLVAPLTHLAYVTMTIDQYDKAQSLAQKSLMLSRRCTDPYYEAFAWRILGSIERARGSYRAAQSHYQRGFQISHDIGDYFGESTALDAFGICARVQGDSEAAKQYHEQGLALCRRLGDIQGEGWLLHSLATDYWYDGAYEEAKILLEEALQKAVSIGGIRLRGAVLYRLGNYKWLRGDHAGAKQDYQAIIRIHETLNDRQAMGYVLDNIGLLTLYAGEVEKAQQYSEKVLSIAREIGDQSLEGFGLVSLGHTLAVQGKHEAAAKAYTESLTIWQALERERPSVKPKAGLALLALNAGDQEKALRFIEEILIYLENNSIDGTDEPFRIYWACCHVLLSAGDARADNFLETTHQRLQDRANAINNPSHRRAFLEDVPFHKKIVEAFACN